MRKRSTAQGHIYFVTDGEAIKIGFAKDVTKRMLSLQTSHHFPLFLLGSIPATRDEENILHRRFCHLRLQGEWFRVSKEITSYIDDLDRLNRLIEGDRIEEFELSLDIEAIGRTK